MKVVDRPYTPEAVAVKPQTTAEVGLLAVSYTHLDVYKRQPVEYPLFHKSFPFHSYYGFRFSLPVDINEKNWPHLKSSGSMIFFAFAALDLIVKRVEGECYVAFFGTLRLAAPDIGADIFCFTLRYTAVDCNIELCTYIPVSYTHLDVYKRQTYKCIICP